MVCDGKDVVPFFSLSVLGWAVGASWFDFVAKFCKGHMDEGL